ncbi:transporter substrate-binding domain-containing protein [Halocynthiibacter sp.]|uniref:transporter substrate-binding domain-containing protein n=1 Tax=Halocynthiibacter sp. TaxID=1979210 RepID=UPI003C344984
MQTHRLSGLFSWLLFLRKLVLSVLLCVSFPAIAQEQPLSADNSGVLRFATVERPPFAMDIANDPRGFSIDLMRDIASEMDLRVEFLPYDSFREMFEAVTRGEIDGAIANISITSAREEIMDFSQPIIASGLQIMLHDEKTGSPVLEAIFNLDILFAILAAFGLLALGGLVMWCLERKSQPYFDRPMTEAFFPSFWWALNLVVNGGFEERVPQSRPGRVFAVLLVVSSLFIVSVFVAQITAAITLGAITEEINSLSDIEERRVATTEGSTASAFLAKREIQHLTTKDYTSLITGFENREFDAVFFDQPMLSWYVRNQPPGTVRLLDRVFHPENYGIALSENSPLRESVNRALLNLRENGRYDTIYTKWFGVR